RPRHRGAPQMSRGPEDFVRSTVRPLAAYGPPRDPAAVPLHLNESPSDVPPELKRELSAQLQAMDWSKYPITDGQRLAADMVRAAEGTKLVLLGSPNNPTGTTLSFEDATSLARQLPCLLGIDEAYRDFCAQDFAPLLSRHPRLVLFRTFSKAFAAASLRAGCMLGAPALCAELRKVQLPYNL